LTLTVSFEDQHEHIHTSGAHAHQVRATFQRHDPLSGRQLEASVYAKRKLFAENAYGYNNITQVEIEGIK
jgi:hypothetical protein